MSRSHTSDAGFTLIEVLAAMLIMAIVIPVVVQGATLANRVGEVGARASKAAYLADLKLDELIVTEAYLDGDQSGDFGGVYPGYEWHMTSQAWDEDTMRELMVEVSFTVQGQSYSASVSTLVPEETSDDTTSDDTSSEGAAS